MRNFYAWFDDMNEKQSKVCVWMRISIMDYDGNFYGWFDYKLDLIGHWNGFEVEIEIEICFLFFKTTTCAL